MAVSNLPFLRLLGKCEQILFSCFWVILSTSKSHHVRVNGFSSDEGIVSVSTACHVWRVVLSKALSHLNPASWGEG